MQPNPCSASDPAYFALIQKIIAQAAARKTQAIVDIHHYGGYARHKIGDGTVTRAQFAQFWQMLAAALKSLPGLDGCDLMSEPSNTPSTSVWPSVTPAAVTAIRKFDTGFNIFVEGNNWASAGSWTTNNTNLTINDPRSRTISEAHATAIETQAARISTEQPKHPTALRWIRWPNGSTFLQTGARLRAASA